MLDAADALRAKRRQALAKLDTLTQAIFIDMFGDPTANPHRWATSNLGDLVAEGTSVTYGIVQAMNSGLVNPFLFPGQTQSAAGLAALERDPRALPDAGPSLWWAAAESG